MTLARLGCILSGSHIERPLTDLAAGPELDAASAGHAALCLLNHEQQVYPLKSQAEAILSAVKLSQQSAPELGSGQDEHRSFSDSI